MAGTTFVIVSPDVLNIETVWRALLWVQHFASLKLPELDDDQLKARLSKLSGVSIQASRYDPDHHFGPVITAEGTRGGKSQSLEIIVPWSTVLAVVRDNTGKFKPGFRME